VLRDDRLGIIMGRTGRYVVANGLPQSAVSVRANDERGLSQCWQQMTHECVPNHESCNFAYGNEFVVVKK
jgi:hypothetical protein